MRLITPDLNRLAKGDQCTVVGYWRFYAIRQAWGNLSLLHDMESFECRVVSTAVENQKRRRPGISRVVSYIVAPAIVLKSNRYMLSAIATRSLHRTWEGTPTREIRALTKRLSESSVKELLGWWLEKTLGPPKVALVPMKSPLERTFARWLLKQHSGDFDYDDNALKDMAMDSPDVTTIPV